LNRSNQKTSIPFRPDIEGLRALAVGLVIASHAELPFLRGGFVGVDVFFVLSGYLITSLLMQEISSSGTVNFARFLWRDRKSDPAPAISHCPLGPDTWAGGTRRDLVSAQLERKREGPDPVVQPSIGFECAQPVTSGGLNESDQQIVYVGKNGK
jgi:hypothetical protein